MVAWMFIGFGLAYMVWGLHRAWKGKEHTHSHIHLDGASHDHEHDHTHEHAHVHEGVNDTNADEADSKVTEAKKLTPWILFTIFVLGPCEPLIPILMYPAAQHNVGGLILVTAIFCIVTIGTMTTIVVASYLGMDKLPFKTKSLEKFMHAIAGGTIAASGMAIQFLGL
jgi:ABC-type nickel/cobalt efflux system permease component RcnA